MSNGYHDPRERAPRSRKLANDDGYLNPPANGVEARSKHIGLRYTSEDYRLISYLAMKEGITAAQWCERRLRPILVAAKTWGQNLREGA